MTEQNLEQNVEEQESVDTQQNQEKITENKQSEDIQQSQKTGDDKEGFFASTMKYIRGAMKSGKEDAESDEAEVSLSGIDIPDDFSDAAEALGWSSDSIIEFASSGNSGKPYTNDELQSMIPDLLAQLKEEDESEGDKLDKNDKSSETDRIEDKVKTQETKLTEIPDELREQLKKEILDELNLGDMQSEFQSLKEDRQRQRDIAVLNRANELFDDTSKEFEIFGKTKNLPTYPAGRHKGSLISSNPAVKARTEVFGDALAFMSHYGVTIDEAMTKAINAYAGKHLKDDVRRKIIKDLKSHEKVLSGSRVSKEIRKSYPSEREEDIDYIRNLQKAAGQDVV